MPGIEGINLIIKNMYLQDGVGLRVSLGNVSRTIGISSFEADPEY